jgi:hypothetical protein
VFKGFIDFPCFVNYDEVNSCVAASDGYPGVDEEKRIQVFLDVSRLGFSGAGCKAEGSFTDVLELATPATSLKFERVDNFLYVNGKELKTGKQFVFTNYWGINPWTIERIEFTNYGIVPVCGGSKPPQIYVIGSYGNQISILKALLLLILCLLIVYLISRHIKRNESVRIVETK